MKKRAISSLLVALIAVSFILPALATEADENAEDGETSAADPAEFSEEPSTEPEPKSFVLLDGVPQFIEYEVRDGTTYATVSSFVSMADPEAVVEEENCSGIAVVSSSRVEQVVDGEGNTADVVRETLSMTVSIRVAYLIANGRYFYVKDNLIMMNGHVAAPLRILAQVFNLDVGYDVAEQAAMLTHGEGRSAYIEPGESYYDADELYWLSRIIHAESGNQSLDGKIAVGNVVMNRVNAPQFPNTVYDVLSQKNQFVSPNTLKKKTPNSESVVAAKLVLEGAQVVPTALFFNQAGISCYASRNRDYVTTIGAHAFYA